jgi:hypothetical protein
MAKETGSIFFGRFFIASSLVEQGSLTILAKMGNFRIDLFW